MIEQISWEQFLLGLGALVLLYYAYVMARYYSREISRGFQKRPHKQEKKPKRSTLIQLNEEEFDRAFTELHKLTTDISAIASQCQSPEELLEELRQRLAHFKGRHVPAFQKTLISHTLRYAQLQGLSLSREALSHTIQHA
ncbi:hypothetical protein [Echinicola vietnamensis]|uniref:Uncharacterized protein n=1 Tax=Echinicola vietnamensis (strain DSM 17526 / LMG 23754 / KMM 6221) TaxID=926556 RepID=L0FZZ9_ECHVK|nr:hypothetical protein [Echinicola vietnamensis]AGA78205.1 hypothetical protein Echvi_1951 [Echinicola vietnamensis DSM 17526]